MANKHLLSLDIPDVNSPYFLKINDSSAYADNLQRTCGEVYVTPPGFTDPVIIPVEPGFKLILNACDLGLQAVNCETIFNRLPDGIYIIRYSVAPNDLVYVEYNYLRETEVLNQYYNALACLEFSMSQDPDPANMDILKELRLIRSFLDAAKAKVEIIHQPKDGTDLLAYATRRLKRLIETCYL